MFYAPDLRVLLVSCKAAFVVRNTERISLRKQRQFGTSLIAAGALLLLLAPAAFAGPGRSAMRASAFNVAQPVSGAPGGIWVSGTSAESFQTQVLRTVQQHPVGLQHTLAVVSSLAATASSGRDPDLPGPQLSLAGEQAELAQTESALQSFAAGSQAPAANPVTPFASSSQFPQRGNAINNERTWTFKTELDGAFCEITCVVEDRIVATWTIDPGRTADRLIFTSLYFPNSGSYNNIFATGYAFCNGNQCGSLAFPPPSDARNGTGSGTYFVQHDSIPGGQLKDGIAVQGFFTRTGQTIFDRAGTGTATCRTGSDTSCPY